jgi:hypothetical protein
MRSIVRTLSHTLLIAGVAGSAAAAALENPGFEIDFGLRESANVWGARSEAFGEAYQVNAGTDRHPRTAHGGKRVLLINILPNSWNGVWQQIPWGENAAYAWRAHYLIQGGDLPAEASSFMKVEFYDAQDNLLSTVEGERRRQDTGGQWKSDSMQGVTPPGTATVRFVLIAGDAGDGQLYTNRIYWDDASFP